MDASPMRRIDHFAAITAGLVLLIVLLFGPTLFRGQQFGYRDAEQYYYPLHHRTVEQWGAGYLPLWDEGENGGMTLVGNPTAAVLYPGKVIFAVLPFPWASRLYLIGHVLLAFGAMAYALRAVGVSAVGAAIGGMAYGFGGPVVFQYCNAIYLVGAAWLPLGFLAADRWLRGAERRALAGLAVVLSLQCLGGDIQCAYVLGMFTAAYALWLTVADRVRWPSWKAWLGVGLGWVIVVVVLAAFLPSFRRDGISETTASWVGRAVKFGVLGAMGWALWRGLSDRRFAFGRLCVGLIVAAVVGAMIASAQLVPVAELASQSFRASSDNRMDIYGFSLEPYRLAEIAWPGFFGLEYPENRLWLLAIPPTAGHTIWTASLYMGGLAGLLAIAAAFGRGGPAWRGPAAILVAASLLLSFGRYGSPLWWARTIPQVASILGPQGPSGSFFFRSEDGFVRDAFGSPYWLIASLAPGFDGFRFPAKLTVFTSFGIAALAGLGWDRAAGGTAAGTARLARFGIGAGIAGLVLSLVLGPVLTEWWTRSRMVPSLAGPIDPAGAIWELRRAFAQGTVVATASFVLVVAASRGRRWAGPAAILLMAADLAIANSRIIWTVPQSEFDRKPRGIAAIEEAEAKSLRSGPFRITRLAEWHPITWIRQRSPDRLREIVAWERDTLQSGHATLYGQQYVLTPGVLEPEAYVDLFQPWVVELDGPASRMLGLGLGQRIRYFPRRAFDLWGARYFVLPVVADDWLDPNRAIAAFLLNTEPIVVSPRDADSGKIWRESEDWQLLRNPSALPRAWIVHDVNYRTPIEPGSDESRSLKKSLLHQADPFWTIPDRPVEDPRRTAWVEVDDPKKVGLKADGSPPSASEAVAITRRRPGRVEMAATLERDGLVVVADTFAPGWVATIDGVSTPIWRTNRAMRGVVAPKGTHQIILSYEPASFRIGLIVSGFGLVAISALVLTRRPRTEEG